MARGRSRYGFEKRPGRLDDNFSRWLPGTRGANTRGAVTLRLAVCIFATNPRGAVRWPVRPGPLRSRVFRVGAGAGGLEWAVWEPIG